jgi:hypothetical protein
MANLPEHPDTKLSREAVAEALTAAGYPISAQTLATRASRPGPHGAPPYSLFSGRALYRWGDALDWANSVTSSPRRNTSERHAQQAA